MSQCVKDVRGWISVLELVTPSFLQLLGYGFWLCRTGALVWSFPAVRPPVPKPLRIYTLVDGCLSDPPTTQKE